MNIQEIEYISVKELPIIMRNNETVRKTIIDIAKRRFADRDESDRRFDRMMDELVAQRKKSDEKWEKHHLENKEQWEKHHLEDKAKWDKQSKEFRDEMAAQRKKSDEQWEKHHLEDKAKWEKHSKEFRDEMATQRKKSDEKWEKHHLEDKAKWEKHSKEFRDEMAAQRKKSDEKWEKQRLEDKEQWDKQSKEFRDEMAAQRKDSKEQWDKGYLERKDMLAQIDALGKRIDSSIGALGARWGILSEQSFRNGLKGILEDNFEIKVETITLVDNEGDVFGRPDQVELDIIIKNGILIICELKSSISKSDMYIFERKVRFYEKHYQRQASKMIVISPMADHRAQKVADKLGITVYSHASDIETL